MKYWKYDVCQLIKDFKLNQRTLTAIHTQRIAAERHIENPSLEAEAHNEWIRLHRDLETREAEYQNYVDTVILGMNALPDISKGVLKLWLIEQTTDDDICERLNIKNGVELGRIKKIAVSQFYRVIMEGV